MNVAEKFTKTKYSFDPYPSYGDLFDDEILFAKTFDCYQGSILYLLKRGDQYGVAVVSYGSCSYCDALEGCESVGDLQALSDQINSSIKWKDSKGELLEFLRDKEQFKTQCWFYYYDELPWNAIEEVLK